jgi:hypothetical protein
VWLILQMSVPDMIVAGQPPTPEIQRAFGVEPAPATTAPVPTKGKGFSGLPDWGDQHARDAATGQFVSKPSDAGIVACLGLAPEVAAVLSAQPDGMGGAVDRLRDAMTRIYGEDAAQVAEWAAELSPAVQAKCAQVLLRNPHVRKSELAKRIRQTLTLNEAAEIEAWLNKD